MTSGKRDRKFATALQTCIAFLVLAMTAASPLMAQPVAPASYSDVAARPEQAANQAPAASDMFVLTQIYQDVQTEPIETHRIAFQDGVFYDFPSQPNQPWTIFDLPKSRVILLDRKRQQQTSVSTEDLLRLSVQTETKITDPAQRQRFGMDAEVRSVPGSPSHRFELSYEQTRYEAIAEKPPVPAMAYQYGQFVDWACRLNIARPQGVPPFARMRLNQAMVAQALYGRQINVELSRVVGSDPKPVTLQLRSETTLSSEISDTVTDQIKQAQNLRVLFNAVPWDQFES